MSENNNVLEKIKNLFDKAESCRGLGELNEMNSAINLANKLMVKYNIEKFQLTKKEEEEEILSSGDIIQYGDSYGNWLNILICEICNAHQCLFIRTSARKISEKKGEILGYKEDVDLCVYLCNNIPTKIIKEINDRLTPKFKEIVYNKSLAKTKKQKTEATRSYKKSFLMGASVAYRENLKKNFDNYDLDDKSIAIYKDIEKNKFKAVENYMNEKMNVKTVKSKLRNSSSIGFNSEAYNSGKSFGSSLSSNKRVNGSTISDRKKLA